MLALGPLVVLALAASFPAASAYPRPGRTEMVSVAVEGWADAYSHYPYISDDGRFVAYQSASTNLVAGDTNNQTDIFIRDLQEGVTERLNVAVDGTESNFNSGGVTMSPSGRYVAWSTMATNVLSEDANNIWDVLVKDVQTGELMLASVANDGTQGGGWSVAPSAGGLDSGVIAFESDATNLVPNDTNGVRDVFVRDFRTGTTTLVSSSASGELGNAVSNSASVSADGRLVAFSSMASNLVPGDSNERGDAFVKDIVTGQIQRITLTDLDGETNLGGGGAVISGDGSTVMFSSASNDIVPADGNAGGNQFGISDVFIRDLVAGTTERVSVSSAGVEANSTSGGHALSADGRYVTFATGANNLVPGDTNGRPDLFLHDRVTGLTERISVNADGTEATGGLFGTSRGAPNADGSVVAFASDNPNIVPGDTGLGFDSDIFVRRRGPALGLAELRVQRGPDGLTVEGVANFSGLLAASASDPIGDGREELGADLSGASVIVRPENEDLLVRLQVTRLPGVRTPSVKPSQPGAALPGLAGVPAVVHSLSFRLGGISHELRALRAGASAVPPGAPLFALYRCEVSCVEVAHLAGGYGTTGAEIRFAVPFASLGVSGPATLTQLLVSAGVGEAAVGIVHTLDTLSVPDVAIVAPTIEIGVAPPDLAEHQVPFQPGPSLTSGIFSATLAHPGGPARVWARACLGTTCAAASMPAPD